MVGFLSYYNKELIEESLNNPFYGSFIYYFAESGDWIPDMSAYSQKKGMKL